MALDNPQVSVVMPVYNAEAYLAASVESVLDQTFSDLELIAIDDGSTDRSSEILAGFSRQDARLKIFRKANSGISDSLNLGLNQAQGRWIARLDADDLMIPSRLAKQLQFVESKPDVAAVGSYYGVIDSNGIYKATRYPLPRTQGELEQLLARKEPLAFLHPTMMFRRDIALDLGGYRREYEPCEDTDLFARMLKLGHSILIQPDVLTHYRVHSKSISSKNALRMFTMLRFIFANFYAERAGHTPTTYQDFLDDHTSGPLGRRLIWHRDIAWELMMRGHTMASIYGRRTKALSCLIAASLLRPDRALRRTLRLFEP